MHYMSIIYKEYKENKIWPIWTKKYAYDTALVVISAKPEEHNSLLKSNYIQILVIIKEHQMTWEYIKALLRVHFSRAIKHFK